ncbi:MAG: NAD-dependent DNA ligase LigA [Bacteroidaceae bacterium]
MESKERILYLRETLHRHNYLYYVKNAPEISDRDFDLLMEELIRLEDTHPEMVDPNSPTKRVGSDLNKDFVQVKHQYPMLSLGNTYNIGEVEAFYERVKNGLGGEAFEVCCELKFDGLSISLIYENGRLVRAVTRGNGIEGDDVTDNVKTIRCIPLQLYGHHYPSQFEIRGEILMPWSSFETLNKEREAREEQLFANPRNAASGTLKSKNSAVVANRKLDAYLYYLQSENTPCEGHYENMKQAEQWGFKISEAMRCVHSLNEIEDFITYWDKERKNLPVATDGIVLKVNSLRQQKELGNTAKSPRWAIAYKFKAERGRTRLNEVTYQVGRTGAITPVANMEAVQLAGTVVRRASLHNEDSMHLLDLRLGDYVYVEKAGEIIPQIVGVDTEARTNGIGDPINFITVCPECGAPLVRYEGEAAYYCTNDTACPPQLKGKIEHYISKDAMNIESLGPETVDDYYKKGLIKNIADLYALKVSDICGEDGTKEKSAIKIIEGIRRSCEVSFERTLYALGIRFIGKVVAKLLARHFGTIDALMSASLDELLQIEGVGIVIAQSVRSYFANERHQELIHKLRIAGVKFSIDEKERRERSNKLAGMSIVISGVFQKHSREEYKMLIEQHGGKNVSGLSAKTTFLLAGENMGPAKLEKATKLGITIQNEDDFLSLIE